MQTLDERAGKHVAEGVEAARRGAGRNVRSRLPAGMRYHGAEGSAGRRECGQTAGSCRAGLRGGGGLRSDAVPAAAALVALDSLPLSAPTQVRRSFRGSARAPLASRHFPFQKTGSSKEHTRFLACFFWTLWGRLGERYGRNERELTEGRLLCYRLRTGVSVGHSPGRRPEPHRDHPARTDAGWCR